MVEKKRSIERRKSPRVQVEVRIQLWKNNRVEKKARGLIKDINLEGMCIETKFKSSEGTDLVFCLDLPNEVKINIYGKIAWRAEVGGLFRYGIKFIELDLGEKPKLYRFILVTLYLSEHR